MRRMFSKNQLEELAKQTIENADSLKVFENITDKDGHKRFVEGDITVPTVSGMTKSYGKWSLSGTHLIIVLALNFDAGTYDSMGVGTIALPSWIMAKIIPFTSNRVMAVAYTFYDSSLQASTGNGWLNKSDSNLQMTLSGLTLSNDVTTRVQIDLLIDNE